GNVTFGASDTLTLDKTVPAFSAIDLAHDVADGFLNAAEHATTNDLVANLDATGHDSTAYALVADGTACTSALTYGASIPKSNATELSADGSFKVCVELKDDAGNPAVYGASDPFTFDETVPTFTSLDLLNDAADTYVNLAETANAND